MLAHEPQTTEVGCMYHALYALTSDPRALTHVDDVSDARFYARLPTLGLLVYPFWVTPATGPTTPPEFWTALREQFAGTAGAQGHAPLLVSIPGSTPGWMHAVAVALPLHADGHAVISDSGAPHLQTLTWAQFLASAYAEAHRVEMLGPLDLTAYPPDHRTP